MADDRIKPAVATLVVAGLGFGILYLMGLTKIAALLAAALVGTAVLLSPLVGLHLVVLSLPLAGLLRLVPVGFTASKGLALLVAISFLPRLVKRPLDDLFKSASLRFYLFITVWWLLLLPFACNQSQAQWELSRQILMVGLALLIATIPQSFQQLQKLCLSATVGSGLLGLWIAFFGAESLNDRGFSGRLEAGTDANGLAFALSIGLILSGIAWQGAGKTRWIVIAVSDALALAAIFLTGSRTAWVSIMFCLIMTPLVVRGIKMKVRIRFLLIFASLIAFSAALILGNVMGDVSDRLVSRFTELFEKGTQVSTSGRKEAIWPTYLAYFRENPIFGTGIGLSSSNPSSHNDWLKIAAEQGLLGVTLYGLMFGVFFRDASRIDVWNVRLVMITLVLFLFANGQGLNTVPLRSYALAVGVLACYVNLEYSVRRRGSVRAPPGGQRKYGPSLEVPNYR